jgi:hypothetical protein
LWEEHNRIVGEQQTINLWYAKKQNAPDPENLADASRAGLAALPVHRPLVAAGLLSGRLGPYAEETSQSR